MKIAAVSDDGFKISQHFGRAPYYVVLTVKEGKILDKEKRPKTGHRNCAGHEHDQMGFGERHGCDAGSEIRHASMAETITDCQVLLAGGMGWGAYESMKSRNIETIVTDVENIDKAVQLYTNGELPNLMDRLH
ncbi:MAG: dinitrogenase iron-molybdenum cofactor biosynthesis protein [Chloroflexi bacterium]|nr:dinitrogenase iron-molybdenum cofactor biosynthesis protein [Chloroflexota bacterium]